MRRRQKPMTMLLAITPVVVLMACQGLAPMSRGGGQKDERQATKGAVLARGNSAKGAPKLACAKPSYNYGTVSAGAKVEHIYIVKNIGQGLLTIKRATGG
ncbi:MAG: hypothetical protein KAI47_26180 [Deltaproteobacteria bacterium]|nr:hypothetical protein [Deltaproteobacteria bacterium]